VFTDFRKSYQKLVCNIELKIKTIIMNDFSLLVRKKYDSLDSEQKQMFNEEYNRRKKPFADDNNNDLALGILRDIAMMFGNTITVPSQQNLSTVEVKNANIPKNSVNSTYLPSKIKSNGDYNYIWKLLLVVVFIGVSAYMKPTKVKMENDIINKFLETQPQFVKLFKDFFIGEEVGEEKAENFLFNALKRRGYDISIKDSDFLILKRIEIINTESQQSLLIAYGFFGKTFLSYKAGDLEVIPNNNKNNLNKGNDLGALRNDNGYKESEKINSNQNYEDSDMYGTSQNKFDENNSAQFQEKSDNENNLIRKRGDIYHSKKKNKLTEDSIKI